MYQLIEAAHHTVSMHDSTQQGSSQDEKTHHTGKSKVSLDEIICMELLFCETQNQLFYYMITDSKYFIMTKKLNHVILTNYPYSLVIIILNYG